MDSIILFPRDLERVSPFRNLGGAWHDCPCGWPAGVERIGLRNSKEKMNGRGTEDRITDGIILQPLPQSERGRPADLAE